MPSTETTPPTRRARKGRRGNGEGTITLRDDGRYMARVSLPDGSRKTYYAPTRDEVARKLAAALADVHRGLPLPGERLTVGQYLEQWLGASRPSVRPSTFASNTMTVRKWWVPALGRLTLAKLTAPKLQSVLNTWHASGASAATVRRRHAVLRRALGQAVRWSLVSQNVATLVSVPHVDHRPVQPLTQDEATAMLAATAGDRLGALYALALALGLRQGEALGLTWGDIDLETGMLNVRHALQRIDGEACLTEPKSRTSVRTIPLPAAIVARLRDHRAAQGRERLLAGNRWRGNTLDLVFTSSVGTPLDGSGVTHRFQAALERAGLPRKRFHDLRHSCASFLLAAGVPVRQVADVLGHAQITLTLSTYAHVMPSEFQRSADVMEGVLTGRK